LDALIVAEQYSVNKELNCAAKMPSQRTTFRTGPEGVPHTIGRQCHPCASNIAFKAFQQPRSHRQCPYKAPAAIVAIRASAVSSPTAAKAIINEIAGAASAVNATKRHRKPQVLAPAGGWPQLRAAVENGADAVYLGLSDFNARARAVNFSPDELPEVLCFPASPPPVRNLAVLINVLAFYFCLL